MLAAILVMALGAVILGAALGFAAIKFKVEGDPLVDKIDAILPQTQCGQCGYVGCAQAAAALARGEHFITERELCRKDGSLVWIRLSGKAIDNADLAKGIQW